MKRRPLLKQRRLSLTPQQPLPHICGTPDALCDTTCMERAERVEQKRPKKKVDYTELLHNVIYHMVTLQRLSDAARGTPAHSHCLDAEMKLRDARDALWDAGIE